MTVVVAHINVARGYRGGERQTELLIRELASSGLRQVLVARRGNVLAARLRDVKVELRPVAGHPFGVAAVTADVDLLHVHEGRSVYAAYLRSLISGTPYVVTRRVNNPIGSSWLAHLAYRRAAWVAGVAPQVAEIIKRYDERARVCVIADSSSGLPVDQGRVAEIRRAHAGKFLIGHVAALDNAQKGQEHIITVAREVAESHRSMHFMLIGGGEDEVMLKDMARGLPNVTFTGFVDNVGDYLEAFDVFLLPSNREGSGSILFDAMERELPLVASSVGGVPDVVHDGENGLLIQPGRPDQLRAAILKLYGDAKLRADMGARGRKIAEEYTAAKMAAKYLDLYRSVLGRLDGR